MYLLMYNCKCAYVSMYRAIGIITNDITSAIRLHKVFSLFLVQPSFKLPGNQGFYFTFYLKIFSFIRTNYRHMVPSKWMCHVPYNITYLLPCSFLVCHRSIQEWLLQLLINKQLTLHLTKMTRRTRTIFLFYVCMLV